jgi:hypothetical protein
MHSVAMGVWVTVTSEFYGDKAECEAAALPCQLQLNSSRFAHRTLRVKLININAAGRRRAHVRRMSCAPRAIFVGVLIAACIFVLAQGSNAATITVNAPDGYGRTFVDVIGDFVADDEKTFEAKVGTLGDPDKVIVTLMSTGGHPAAIEIADLIRLTGMTTFVPAGETCASSCAFVCRATAGPA